MDFIVFLLGMVPWPIWAGLAAAVLLAIQFLWGWKAAVSALITLLPLAGYFWGRKRQSEIDQAQRDRDALRDARYRRDVDQDIAQMGSQDVANELREWNRD